LHGLDGTAFPLGWRRCRRRVFDNGTGEYVAMPIHRLVLAAASLTMTAAVTAQATRPSCGKHPVATAVTSAMGADARNTAARVAEQKVAEHAPGVVSGLLNSSTWKTVASHLPHRSKTKAGPAPATSTPDCR
jgi:hypothetical protein